MVLPEGVFIPSIQARTSTRYLSLPLEGITSSLGRLRWSRTLTPLPARPPWMANYIHHDWKNTDLFVCEVAYVKEKTKESHNCLKPSRLAKH